MVKSLKRFFNPKALVAGIFLAAISVLGLNTLSNNSVAAACANPNNFICAGVSSKQALVNAYNGSGEVQNVYRSGHFGNFNDADRDRFLGSAGHEAKSYKNGKIILDDGRVVATGAYSLGRQGGTGTFNPYSIVIAGKTYYWGYNSTAFKSDGLRTLVLMDSEDKYMQFAAITDCGNPITGDKPKFQCDKLKSEKVNDTTYKFWTEATVNKFATVKNVHYDFGDGQTKDTSNPSEKVSHTYSKAAKYHVTVKVTYVVNGVTQEEKLQINCQTDVEVTEKKVVAKCDSLDKLLIEGTRKYGFVGIASVENATVKSATFDFGDNSTAPGTVSVPINGKVAITGAHQYANSVKEAHIVLTIQFNVKDSTTTEECATDLEFSEETCKDNPNRPECQPKCIPKAGEDSNCHVLSIETCVPQKGEDAECKIPETGPVEVIGSALGLSSIAGAGAYWRASRKSLRDLIKR